MEALAALQDVIKSPEATLSQKASAALSILDYEKAAKESNENNQAALVKELRADIERLTGEVTELETARETAENAQYRIERAKNEQAVAEKRNAAILADGIAAVKAVVALLPPTEQTLFTLIKTLPQVYFGALDDLCVTLNADALAWFKVWRMNVNNSSTQLLDALYISARNGNEPDDRIRCLRQLLIAREVDVDAELSRRQTEEHRERELRIADSIKRRTDEMYIEKMNQMAQWRESAESAAIENRRGNGRNDTDYFQ